MCRATLRLMPPLGCREEGGDTKEFLLKHINNWVSRREGTPWRHTASVTPTVPGKQGTRAPAPHAPCLQSCTPAPALPAPLLQVCRIYCHKVVKLSDAVQPLPKQTTEFVHGVAESFLDVGQKKAQPAPEGGKR